MAAVLSLNGKPQVTLRRAPEDSEQQFVQTQHAASAVAVGASTQQIMQVLGALTRIKISDGRIIVGRLHCFDKHQNVILTDAREYPPLPGSISTSSSSSSSANGKDKGKAVAAVQTNNEGEDDAAFEKHRGASTSRNLGMTLVPGKHIEYIKVQTSPQ